MSHVTDKSKFSIELLDEALKNLQIFKPIEKAALRGCVTEVLAKYYEYIAHERPTSSIAEDVKNFLLCELLSVENGIDMNRIAKAIRAYNSKVPTVYSLKADTILDVYKELLNFDGRPMVVK